MTVLGPSLDRPCFGGGGDPRPRAERWGDHPGLGCGHPLRCDQRALRRLRLLVKHSEFLVKHSETKKIKTWKILEIYRLLMFVDVYCHFIMILYNTCYYCVLLHLMKCQRLYVI